MIQFRHDVLPTERMQMIEVARLEILLNRALAKMKESDVILGDAQKEIDIEKALGDTGDKSKIVNLQMIMSQMNTSHATLTREYRELLERKQSIIKEIRGSREQRIKRIEDSKETIQTWMTAIADNPEYRRILGIEAAKSRLAMYKELERLTNYYEFSDGTTEQLITSEETLKEDNR